MLTRGQVLYMFETVWSWKLGTVTYVRKPPDVWNRNLNGIDDVSLSFDDWRSLSSVIWRKTTWPIYMAAQPVFLVYNKP